MLFYEILSFETGQYTNSTTNILNWLRISPHYCLSNSIYTIAVKDFFFKTGLPYKRNTSLWSLLSIDMLCLLLQGILLFLIVLLLEKRFYIGQIIYWKNKKLKYGHKKINIGSGYTHLESNSQNSEYLPFNTPYAINAESIVKHYWCQKKPTVEHLSLTVQPGECYGLLGVNGAGKSTIYSMLTGNCTITDGHIYLNGYDIELNEAKAFQSIGYCPQQDALCEFMTVREILTFYINKMIQLTGLQDYADQIISKLSGGNKRKLSTCIAFIGNPSIILLDEPSTGMDPQGKYLLWKNIKNALQLNCAILLSSHCMEECELLCNSIGLLINGKICCKGSPLELKTNYGLGYHVNIEFTSNIIQFSNMNKLQSIINQYLPNFQLRYPLLSRQEYNYSKLQPLWKLFNGLEQLNKLNLINYISIRQSSLEDVFVNFINMYEKKSESLNN
ncbi:unnamed protein product [Heterobilharzia americana]|nr:unnamed protein product [Heterobilharzia americana]